MRSHSSFSLRRGRLRRCGRDIPYRKGCLHVYRFPPEYAEFFGGLEAFVGNRVARRLAAALRETISPRRGQIKATEGYRRADGCVHEGAIVGGDYETG